MFKSNLTNTTVSFCVPLELPVQIELRQSLNHHPPVSSFEQLPVFHMSFSLSLVLNIMLLW